MGFWRSLRKWWSWDGSPDTDPFRDPTAADDAVSSDVSGHAQSTVEAEPEQPDGESDD
jgi:hypothetical protein